jgi:hypothetical protein
MSVWNEQQSSKFRGQWTESDVQSQSRAKPPMEFIVSSAGGLENGATSQWRPCANRLQWKQAVLG